MEWKPGFTIRHNGEPTRRESYESEMGRAREEEDRMERRQWPRLPLKLKVDFSPAGQEERVEGSGLTDNVSAGGMHFRTRDWHLLEKGQPLMLKVSGMSSYNHGPLFRTLAGRATILRLDAPESPDVLYARAGVAVRFDERLRVEFANLSA